MWHCDRSKIRSRGIIVLLILAAGLLLWRAVPGIGLLWGGDETLERIRRTGVLRIGMDASYPPFEWVDDAGGFDGFDVDLGTALAQRLGVEAQFVNVHFDGLYDALHAGKFDLIISALPYDRTMTQDVSYSSSYYNAGQVMVAQAALPPLATLDQLDGMAVSVELGSEAHLLARRLVREKGMALEILPQRELSFVPHVVLEGVADVAICDRVSAHQFLAQHKALSIVGHMLTDEPYVIAAQPRARQLVDAINLALAEWQTTGMLGALEERWFGASPTIPPPAS